MTAVTSPFDPPAAPSEKRESHLVLHDDRGTLSLWPVWRAVPEGWHTLFGPASYASCLHRIAAAEGE
ncbi:MbtH family NRPS accessory protein [Streptomyces nodosus]